ncbi:hypothetical protein WJX77_010551 [Trebouxia sp. C0004]
MSAKRTAIALQLVKQLTSVASGSTPASVGPEPAWFATSLCRAAQSIVNRNVGLFGWPRGAHSAHQARSYEQHPFALAAQVPVRRLMKAATLQAPTAQTPEAVLSTDTEQQILEQSAQETDSSSSHATVELPHSLFNLIKRLGKQGKVTELTSIFQQEQMLHAPHPLNTALLSLQPRDVPAFYNIVTEKVAIQPNASSIALVIRAFGQLHKVAQAEAVFNEWQAKGNPLDPVTMGALCGAYGLAGNAEAIENMLEEAKAALLPPVMSAYTSLIKAWGRRKSLVNVRRVLVDMVEDGVQPNQLHFCAAIVAHGQSQRPAESEYLLTQMQEMGIPPDGLTYGALISAYAAAKQPRKAAAVMQDFVDSGGKPSPVLCNQLANAWSKTGAAGEIRAVMASMRLLGMKPDVYTWSSLVHAHAVARQTGRAAEVMREMAGVGINPGVVCYTTLLNAYGTAGDTAAAQQVLTDMIAAGIKPNSITYTSLMGYYSQLGDVARIQALQQDMAKQGLEVDAVTQLFAIEAAMEAWAKAGRPAAALNRADQLLQESNVMEVYPIFRGDNGRDWRSAYIDLHGYGHWSCQLALLAGLRNLYHKFMRPDWRWPNSDLVVAVGKGNSSAQRHQGFVRDAVLHFLQHLVPVKLAAHNDGLVSVRRQDMFKFFDTLSRETPKFDAASFKDCFKARPAEFSGMQNVMRRL